MKILILRFSSIGDIVLCSPVIRCVHHQVEGAEIHFATKSGFAALLQDNPYITKIHRLNGSPAQLIRLLRQEHFDFILDLHHNLRTSLIKAGLAGVASRSFQKLNIRKWLYVRFRKDWLGQQHVVHRYLNTASDLGVVNDGLGLELFLAPGADRLLHQLPPSFQQGFDALVLGARQGTKRPPQELLSAICLDAPHPLLLVGGPEDRETGELLASTHPEKVWNTAGLASLQESAALIRAAEKVISPDTGMMHIASAFGKPVCSIWGSTTPRLGMYPYFGGSDPMQTYLDRGGYLAEVPGLPCRPCSKIGHAACPEGHFRCMRNQDAAAIVQWLRRP